MDKHQMESWLTNEEDALFDEIFTTRAEGNKVTQSETENPPCTTSQNSVNDSNDKHVEQLNTTDSLKEEITLENNKKDIYQNSTKSVNDAGSNGRKRLREVNMRDESTDNKISRNRNSSTSSTSTSSLTNGRKKLEYETDPAILARRQKMIDYGKNTIGYDRYIQAIPKRERLKNHPKTPPKDVKYSRRGWDGMVKLWRKQLHYWDPPEENGKLRDEASPSLS